MSAIASAPAILRRAADALNKAASAMEAPLQPVASAGPVIGSVIPAISAYEADRHDEIFNGDVVYRSPNGDPLYGTIGASWRVHEDLLPVAARLGNNREALIKYVMKDARYEPADQAHKMPSRPTKAMATQLVDIFLFFNDPKQEFFFIKKGTSCQWLVRKTTVYYYALHGSRGTWQMPHRVGYQVIRRATEEESVKQLGRGITTWMKGGMKVSA
jgi:hypothetical protein